jgi:hypothetical protein
MIRQTEFSSVSTVLEYSGGSDLIGEQSVRGLLQFSHCELFLLDAEEAMSGSHYQATVGEDTVDRKGLVLAVVN